MNGDALRVQFPAKLEGDIIVARECLVDGDAGGEDLDDFFHRRARFIMETYNISSIEEYFSTSVTEFKRIMNTPPSSTICLWFEDDLFCQVNLWFVAHLLDTYLKEKKVYLVRPQTHDQFGFGGLIQSELLQAFNDRIVLNDLDKFACLWRYYQKHDTDSLLKTASELKESYPFVTAAAEAHIARLPDSNGLGRPFQTLTEIINELGTDDFGTIFKEFSKRESIYGFGDVQVKRLLRQVQSSM